MMSRKQYRRHTCTKSRFRRPKPTAIEWLHSLVAYEKSRKNGNTETPAA